MTLRFDAVCAGYGRSTVLHDVTLAVPSGQTVGLLGANGAGKTTLLKTAAGFLRPARGAIHVDGEAIDDLSEAERAQRGICLLPEVSQGIFRQLTVRENIAMFARGKRVSEAIDKAVAAFPILGERLAQEAGTLSGGQQQMLSVSRALIVDAGMILADELSLGLAPVIVDEIFDVVGRFRSEGRSLLLVDQFVERVLAIADYVYILHKGAVVFAGDSAECRSHEEIFAHYVGSVN